MPQGFQHFLNSAGRYPLLTHDQELTLGRAVQAWEEIKDVQNPTPDQVRIARRGKRAYEKFFKSNLRLVISVSKKYAHLCSFHTMDDLIQETNFNLPATIFEPMETIGLPQVRQVIEGAPQRIFDNLRERS